MARGDVVSGIGDIATTAALEVRPGVGEEWLITEIASSAFDGARPDNTPNVDVILRNVGGDKASVLKPGGYAWGRPLRIFLNNTIYLEIKNNLGSNAIISYCGVVLKG